MRVGAAHISIGDMHMWKPVPAFQGLYEVSNTGQVRSVERTVQCKSSNGTVSRLYKSQLLKPQLNKKGYLKIKLYRTKSDWKMFFVHRIVAAAFLDNPKNLPQVNHKDGDKCNNAASNLEWITNADNMRHAFVTGVRRNESGIAAANARLTEEQVRLVVRMRSDGKPLKEIAKLVQCTTQNVNRICSGKTWSSLTGIQYAE